jgi:hypothetical protein
MSACVVLRSSLQFAVRRRFDRAVFPGVKSMKKLIVLLALPLAGCGITAKIDARQDYEVSETQYKALFGLI